MSRRISIFCTMIVFAFIFAASGCSSASNPTLVARSSAARIRGTPQSPGGWTTKAPMPTARTELAAGVVNGILYAIGGRLDQGGTFDTVEAYNPATDSWSTKKHMPAGRWGLAAGVINGILYAVGGYNFNGYLNTVDAYDPATNTWTAKAPMPTPRFGLAVAVSNGILYAVGGFNSSSVLNTVEAYDPSTDSWSS